MMKKDISANFHQKCLILCSKILINVLHNLNLDSSVTMATYWVPDLPIIKGVSGQACVSQKTRKLYGPGKAPEKFPKTILGVSQNARGFRARKKLVVFPRNFTGACVLPKKV